MITAETLLAFLNSITWPLVFILIMAGLDLLFGVIVALKSKTFQWTRLADFLTTNLPKILVWLAMEFIMSTLLTLDLPSQVVQLFAEFSPTAIYAFLIASFLGSLIGHFMALGAWPPGQKKLELTPTETKKE